MDRVKQEYWSKMADTISAALASKGLPDEVILHMQFNIVGLCPGFDLPLCLSLELETDGDGGIKSRLEIEPN